METYVEYDICVNKKTYHVTVSEEHNSRGVLVIVSTKHDNHISWALGNAICNPVDKFDLAIGVKTAVERMFIVHGELRRPIWHGFRRAQWRKLHDVTDEQMMITHWMPIENVKKQDDDDWISVEERLPEVENWSSIYSICVEVMFEDGTTCDDSCYAILSDTVRAKTGTWSTPGHRWRDGYGAKVIRWRPMRGNK